MANLDIDGVLKSYGLASDQMMTWYSQLQQTYNLVLPNKSKFLNKDRLPGQPYTQHVYDWTAVTGSQKYASNILQNLMPNGQHWAKFKPGNALLKKGEEPSQEIKETFQYYEDTLFSLLDNSNFYLAAHQSMCEMSISTGILLIQEGDTREKPFSFVSVPLHEVVLSGNTGTGEVNDVYRKFKVPGKDVLTMWPGAQLSEATVQNISLNPDLQIELLEGTIYYADMPADKQYCYFVIALDTKDLILEEFRSYSPWIIFRSNVYSGELLGRGVMLDMLSAIRTLNRLAEDELRLNTFLSKPIFLSKTGNTVNPYTARIEPGSIIPYQSEPGSNESPISQLTIQGNLQYSQLNRQEIKAELISALGINPVADPNSPRKTATEVSLLDNQWKRENQELAGRLQQELAMSVLQKCFGICQKLGFWKALKIDHHHIKVEFDSPITDYQSTIDVQKVVSYAEMTAQIFGPQGAETALNYGLDSTKLPTWMANKLHLSPDIVRDDLSKHAMMTQASQQISAEQTQKGLPDESESELAATRTPISGASGGGTAGVQGGAASGMGDGS